MPPRFLPSVLGLTLCFILLFFLCPLTRRPLGVSGRVSDGLRPVAGARVRFQGECPATRTDARGYFRLRRPARTGRVTAWKEGFGIAGASPLRRPLELTLKRLPDGDDEDYRWIDPTPDPARANNCGN